MTKKFASSSLVFARTLTDALFQFFENFVVGIMELGLESIGVIDAILPRSHVREIHGPVGPGWFP